MSRNRLTAAQYAAFAEARAKPIRKAVPRERDVQAAIRDWLTLDGWWVMRVNSGAMTGTYKGKKRFFRFTDRTGVSDLFAAKGERWCWIEVKRPGEGASLAQQLFLADVRKHGGVGIVARSIDEVREALA